MNRRDYKVLITFRPYLDYDKNPPVLVTDDESVRVAYDCLIQAGFATEIICVGEDIDQVLSRYNPQHTVIFNYCDGYHDDPSGYDPITRMYEEMGFAYTGADDAALFGGADKGIAKEQLVKANIPTPAYRVFERAEPDGWGIFPALVKPAGLHASIGITADSVVENTDQLMTQVRRILDEHKTAALVEDFIEGNEYRVSVWGNGDELEVLPLAHFHYTHPPSRRYKFKDYNTKWEEDGYQLVVPAEVEPTLRAKIEWLAKQSFHAVGMRDYGALDVRVRGDEPFVIDPNQNPDISHLSTFLRAVRAKGMDYPDMLARVVELASERRPVG
jgi:D-alanine-D-alanine ligase